MKSKWMNKTVLAISIQMVWGQLLMLQKSYN